MTADFKAAGTFAHENLFAGDFPVVEKKITLLGGTGGVGEAVAGSVMAIDAAGKGVLVNSAAGITGDVRRTPYGVLRYAADATAGDVEAHVCLTGDFNRVALTFGGSDTAANHEAALRALSIFIHKTNQGA